MSREVSYRSEIDGLRCLAVVVVLLYHVGIGGFSGGYVGVDIFFVISGYLITKKIINELDRNGHFNFGEFYSGRIKRLFPAMYATMAASFIAAFLIFPPELMRSFSETLVATIFSVSNILFWSQSGYFDTVSLQKPLLHTWSLSVEEQFYLFWPIVLVFTAKFLRKLWLPVIIGVIFLISIGLSIVWINHSSAIYFLLPFRAFELAIGGFMVWGEKRRARTNAVNEFILLSGLAAIIVCVVIYDDTTVFPSYNALLPCIGAAAVIFSGKTAYVSRALTIRPIVKIGLISYSLYLVHWPIIVFYTYTLMRPITLFDKVVLCAASVLAAFLLFYLVERPILSASRRSSFTVYRTWISAALAAAMVIVPASHSWSSDGWQWRYSPEILKLMSSANSSNGVSSYPNSCFLDPSMDPRALNLACYTTKRNGKKNVLIIGDSTADHLVDGLYTELAGKVNLYEWTVAVCPAVRGYDSAHGNPGCKAAMEYFFSEVLPKNHYDLVVVAQLFNFSAVKGGMRDTVKAFETAGASVVLMGQPLYFKESTSGLVARRGTIDGLSEFMRGSMDTQCLEEFDLDKLVDKDRFFKIKSVLCNNGYPVFEVGGELIHKDHVHLNGHGSRYLARQFLPWLEARGLL